MDDTAYQCLVCKQWYIRVANVSCCVMHPAGQCCHYADRLATQVEIDAAQQPKVLLARYLRGLSL